MDLQEELVFAKRLAREAGELALSFYGKELDVEEKPGAAGPVTAADIQVNAFLVSLLPWPTSEQSAATGQPCSNENGSEGAGCRTCPANDRKPKRRTDLHGHSAGLPFSRQSRRGRVRFAEIR